MKNGLSIASVSEAMHEIRENAREGVFAYSAEAQWAGGDSLIAFVNAALIGSVKSARQFQWRVTLNEAAPVSDVCTREMLLTPEELALTGLGACAMLTMVVGATTCGRTIQRLRFLIKATQYSSDNNRPARLEDVNYHIELDTESEDDDTVFSDIVRKLSQHSPNHRTIVERNQIVIPDAHLTVNQVDPVPLGETHNALHVDIHWEQGLQLIAHYDDVRYTHVDQSKQGGGVDKGANPQEILLSALAACIARRVVLLMSTAALSLKGLSVRTSGYVDMRGMLGIDPTIPSKVQEITVVLDIDSAENPETIASIIQQAVQQSSIARLLIEPQTIHLTLQRQGISILHFVSQSE